MNTLNELVEGAGQFAKLVFVFNRQTPRQVAFTLRDVLHGAAHGRQRTHQYTNQQTQQECNHCHSNHRCDECRSPEFGERRVGFIFIQ